MFEIIRTPELRFPEFNDTWQIKSINNLFNIKNGYAFSSNDSQKKGVRWIKIADVGIGKIENNNMSFLPAIYTEKHKEYLLFKGDYVVALTRPTLSGRLKVARIDDSSNKSLLNQRVGKILSTENLDFVYQRLQDKSLIFKIENLIAGSDPPNLSPNEIRGIKIGVPHSEEQQKIASFLSAVDERIQLLQKKKAKLVEYKKGVMQKLFSQETEERGSRTPNSKNKKREQIRFKDENGNDYPDWEEKKLRDLCEKAQSGGTPKSTNRDYYNGDIPFLSISDMTAQGKYLKYTSKSISQEGLQNSSSWVVPPNSLIYSMYASVGFVSINKIPIATSQAVMNIIIKEGYEQEYFYYYLLYFQSKIHRYIETGTQGNINAQIVKNLLVPGPSLLEQRKIASFLSQLDELIDSIGRKIEGTSTFKKGLLQKMFV